MPFDHSFQRLDDKKRGDFLVLQHGLGRVAASPSPPTTTSSPCSESSASPSRAKAISDAVNRLDIRNSSPSLISKTSTPSLNSRCLRKLNAPIGVGR
jgi:hypothetical protein